MTFKFLTAVAALAWLASACSTDEPQMAANDSDNPGLMPSSEKAGPLFFLGTVNHVPDNGGVWVLRSAAGKQYQPVALPEEFQVDGMAVEVQARKHDDVMTKDMLGPKIDIVEIRRQGAGN